MDGRGWKRRIKPATAGIALSLSGVVGCDLGRDFRAAAVPNLQSGVTTILTGLVDGVFAAIEVENEDSSGSGRSSP